MLQDKLAFWGLSLELEPEISGCVTHSLRCKTVEPGAELGVGRLSRPPVLRPKILRDVSKISPWSWHKSWIRTWEPSNETCLTFGPPPPHLLLLPPLTPLLFVWQPNTFGHTYLAVFDSPTVTIATKCFEPAKRWLSWFFSEPENIPFDKIIILSHSIASGKYFSLR